MRRNLMNLGLALLLVPATIFLVLKKMPEPPKGVLTFPKSPHRVALALDEMLRLELATVAPSPADFQYYLSALGTGGVGMPVTQGDTTGNDSHFMISWAGTARPGAKSPSLTPCTVTQMGFEGKTRDGRSVKITIQSDPIGEGSVVDLHGDEALARALSPRIADRLAHPRHAIGSPEDHQALVAFFTPMLPLKFAPVAGYAAIPVDQTVKKANAEVGIDPEDEDK